MCFPLQGAKHDRLSPAEMMLGVFKCIGDGASSVAGALAGAVLLWAFVIGLAALLMAWLVQSVVQIVKAKD